MPAGLNMQAIHSSMHFGWRPVSCVYFLSSAAENATLAVECAQASACELGHPVIITCQASAR